MDTVAVDIVAADGVLTIAITGEATPQACEQLNHAFAQAADTSTAIVVDMTKVTFLSLECLSALTLLALRCAEHGKTLRVEPSPPVLRKIESTGLGSVIPLATGE